MTWNNIFATEDIDNYRYHGGTIRPDRWWCEMFTSHNSMAVTSLKRTVKFASFFLFVDMARLFSNRSWNFHAQMVDKVYLILGSTVIMLYCRCIFVHMVTYAVSNIISVSRNRKGGGGLDLLNLLDINLIIWQQFIKMCTLFKLQAPMNRTSSQVLTMEAT